MELEFIKKFIDERQKLVDEQKAKLKEVDDKLIADCIKYFLEHSDINIGTDISITTTKWDGTSKENYYRVSRIDANTDGTISIYGNKRKANKEFGIRDIYITNSSIYNTSISKVYNVINK